MNIGELKKLIADLPDDMRVYTTNVYQGDSYVEEDLYLGVIDIYVDTFHSGIPGRAPSITLYESEYAARRVTTRPLTTIKALML